jgi:hypothetical protein
MAERASFSGDSIGTSTSKDYAIKEAASEVANSRIGYAV